MTMASHWIPLLLAISTGGLLCHAQVDPEEGWVHYDIDDMTVSTGSKHVCALEMVEGLEIGGKAVCWGSNAQGQAMPPEVRCLP